MSVLDFSLRLKTIMQTEKVSTRALSIQTGLQRKSITNWINAKFCPRFDALIKLSDFFYVSIDYLIGRSADASKIVNMVKNPITCVPVKFAGILTEYISKENLTKYKLAKELKIGQSTLSRWFDGHSMPETAVLIRIANLMGESLDYLLSRE